MELDRKEMVFKQEIKEEDEVYFELIEEQSYFPESVKEEIVLNDIEQVENYVDLVDSQSYFVVDGIKEETKMKQEDSDDIQINDNAEFKEVEINCEWPEAILNERDPLDLSEMQATSLLLHYESAQSSSCVNTNDTEKVRLKAFEGSEYQRTSSPFSNNDPIGQHPVCVTTSLQPTTSRIIVYKYVCSECNYSCAKSCTLRRHKMLHSGEKPFKCKECDYSCIRSNDFKNHTMMHRPTGEKPFKCNECDYSCNQPSKLKKHTMMHTSEKPVKPSKLKKHTMMDTGEKPFTCNECDYSCKTPINLKRHKLRHTGEKPFKCKECDYSCNQLGNLKRHQMWHMGEKPFKCKECNYSCIQSSQFKSHKMRHSGEKPFKCKHCDYSCSHSQSLKKHVLKHKNNFCM